MLNQLKYAVPLGCVSDLTFDEWRAGELESPELERVEEHLASCEPCRQRHEQLQAEAEDFLTRYPELEGPVSPEKSPVSARAAAGERPAVSSVAPRSRRLRRWAWASGTAVAAAAAFFLVLGRAGTGTPDGETRLKGGARIGFFVSSGGSVRPGRGGQVVHPGDRLRFTVTTPRPVYVAILSLDGAGAASVYYPTGAESQHLGIVRDQALESSVELDGTLGDERIWGVFCDAPFEIEPLRTALERRRDLPALSGCTNDLLGLVKKPAP
ncbi:MAG TPA: zf-HC2 domain-containing protein [Polyangiaceae bacterium]